MNLLDTVKKCFDYYKDKNIILVSLVLNAIVFIAISGVVTFLILLPYMLLPFLLFWLCAWGFLYSYKEEE